MATILYKDGKQYKVSPLDVQRHIDLGYTVTNEPVKDPINQDAESSDTSNNTDPEKAKRDPKEIRELAKKAGIENADTARIKTLEKSLEELEEDGD